MPVPLPKELKKEETEVGVMAVELLIDMDGWLLPLRRAPPLDIEWTAVLSVVK